MRETLCAASTEKYSVLAAHVEVRPSAAQAYR
jgi:hypothetical protein